MAVRALYWIWFLCVGILVACLVYSCRTGCAEGFQSAYQEPAEMLLINIDTRQDRLTQFMNRYDVSDCKDKLPLQRRSAVVGKEVDWRNGLLTPEAAEELETTVVTGKRKGHDSLSVGAVGCYLSHLKALEYVVEQNRPMIVCEDDLELPPDFYAKMQAYLLLPPPNQPMMLLFNVICNGWEKLQCSLLKDNLYEVKKFWSTACYYITPDAAKIILDNAKPLRVQVDAMISELSKNNKLKVYAYHFVETNKSLGTDIQTFIQ